MNRGLAAVGGALALGLGGCTGLAFAPEARLAQTSDVSTLPLQLDDGVPLIDVHIGGKGPFLFKVDTGSGPSVVSARLAARLQLPTRRVSGSLTGANGETRAFDHVAEIASLELGDAVALLGARAVVLPAEELDVHDVRQPVEGILGYALFADATLTIDHPERTMSLSRTPLPPVDDIEVLPMKIVSKTPRVVGLVCGRPFEVLIDTGNDQSLIFADEDTTRLAFVAPPVQGPMLSTVSGMTRVRIGRLDGDLQLGRHSVRQPMVSVMPCKQPMLGADLLRHFKVSFDARAGSVRFERASERPVVVESRSTDGLGLRRVGPAWQVIDVIPGSPADVAGIRVGDDVRSIDYVGEGLYRVEVGQHGVFRAVALQPSVLVK